MVRVSTFIDRPISALGRAQVGSANIADLAVTREKIADRAVGSTQHGTLDLRRAVGTVSNLDIGTWTASYGSAGTLATRLVRAQYGSFVGSVRAAYIRGGTIQIGPDTLISRRGVDLIVIPDNLRIHRGATGSEALGVRLETDTVNRWQVAAGGVGALGPGNASVDVTYQRVGPGTFRFNQSLVIQRTLQGGTVPAARLRSGTIGSRSATGGAFGSYGTTVGQIVRGRYGSFTGTIRAPLLRGQNGSFGTVRGHIGSFGTLLHGLLRGGYGSHGTMRAGIMRGVVGSFGRTTGSLGASRVTHGTLATERIARQVRDAEGLRLLFGTLPIGSVRSTAAAQGVAFSPRGHLWLVDSSSIYSYQFGTLGLRGGTNSRFGTQAIGSFRSPSSTPTGLAISPRGHVWQTNVTSDYIYQLGTLALRGGTNSRLGTQAIGSVRSPAGNPRGIAFSAPGHLWHCDPESNYIYQFGTLGLRAGTNSRIGTQAIGSVRALGGTPIGITFDRRGRLWHTRDIPDYLYQFGTLGLRNGTNSRIGTRLIGSIRPPSTQARGVAFSSSGHLWHSDTSSDYIYQFGTTPGTLHAVQRRLDEIYGRYGSWSGTVRSALLRGGMGSMGTESVQFLRGRFGSFTGTIRAPLLRGQNGSFGTTRGHIGSFGTILHGLLRGGYGSHGTSRARVVRGGYGSFTGTLQAPLVRAAMGSTGTGAVQILRGRYGSFFGTVRAPLMRAGMGSLGTGAGQFIRGRYGSFMGTLRAPVLRGRLGSFSRLAGSLPASRVTFGTIAEARLRQYLGTHLAGTFTANEARTRYAVWPVAFPNATYRPSLQVETRGTQTGPQFLALANARTAGSLRYTVRSLEAANRDPPGTIHIAGWPS